MVPSRSRIALAGLLAAACGDAPLRLIVFGSDSSAAIDAGDGGEGDGGPLPEGGGGFGPGARLAAYWGQDRFGGANPTAPPSEQEQSLADTCTRGRYDVVVVGYVTDVASGSDATPAAFRDNLANHCSAATSLPGSGVPLCEEMAQGIQACHAAKKKVLLSIGPFDPGLSADADGGLGVQAAHSMWDMFLGGDAGPRPFGAAPMDGVDLDYDAPRSAGFSAFVAELRALMTASGGTYFITASPQCSYPDDVLGPVGGPIGDHPGAFDALFVKFFYETGQCEYSTPDAGFATAFLRWAGFARGGLPQIFVGLPASASIPQSGAGFVDRGDLASLVGVVQPSGVFGGIMLLDVSYDQNSADDAGVTYGQAVKAVLP